MAVSPNFAEKSRMGDKQVKKFGKTAGGILAVAEIVWAIYSWITDSGFVGIIDIGPPEYAAFVTIGVLALSYFGWANFRRLWPSVRLAELYDEIVAEWEGTQCDLTADSEAVLTPRRTMFECKHQRSALKDKLNRLGIDSPGAFEHGDWIHFSSELATLAKTRNIKAARKLLGQHIVSP